jgi:hypothetical protein
MKKIFTLLVGIVFSITILMAQAPPQAFSYKATITRTLPNGNVVAVVNKTVGLQIDILKGDAKELFYSETFKPKTNLSGQIDIEIGKGTIVTGDFSSIPWSGDIFFLQVWVDINGGSAYGLNPMSITQLLSVPYALYAGEAGSAVNETDPIFSLHPAHGISSGNITDWKTAYGWGNHADAGYLESYTETDPIFINHVANGITNTVIGNWNTAFGWGNHAGLYRPIDYVPAWSEIANKPTTITEFGITDAVTTMGDQTIAGNKTFTGTTTVSNALNAGNGFASIYSETEKKPILGEKGNVSIGTASNWDWSELDVNGGVNILPGQWEWGSGLALSAWDAQGGGGEQYLIGSTGALAHEGAGKFFIRNTNHYWDAIFIMDNQGRVGIDMGFDGLPQYTLDVSGDINFTGELLKNGSPYSTGFLTNETDPIFTSHAANGITATNITNWNTAFNWGNHSGLYRPISYVPAWSEIIGKPTFATVATSGSYNDLNNKPTIDGSETKVTEGTNVTITGVGTEASPYVINSTGGGGSSSHSIGETYGGGIVFYVYDNGQHGLIAATVDQSTGIRWYGGSYTYTRARADGVGAGLKNTAIIIANQGPVDGNAFAATVCNEYSVTVGDVTYGDWYLPSKYELNLLYLQKSVVGGFASNFYWSSTEASSSVAWIQYFTNGYLDYNSKNSTYYVRAVRAF